MAGPESMRESAGEAPAPGAFGRADVELLERRAAHRGYFTTYAYRLRHRRFAGGMSPVLEREVFHRGRVAAVLPVDAQRDRVVLVEQFRPAAYAAGWEPWLLECVAGVVEAGETPADVARREAREEAGCTLLELEPVAEYLSSPGSSTEAVALFCARVDSRGVGGVHGLAAEGEDIRVHVLAVDAALGLLEAGRIVNAKTVIVLLWLAAHYPRLKRAWGAGEGAG